MLQPGSCGGKDSPALLPGRNMTGLFFDCLPEFQVGSSQTYEPFLGYEILRHLIFRGTTMGPSFWKLLKSQVFVSETLKRQGLPIVLSWQQAPIRPRHQEMVARIGEDLSTVLAVPVCMAVVGALDARAP